MMSDKALTINGNVNVTVLERLQLELRHMSVSCTVEVEGDVAHLLLLEFCPFALILDHEALGSLWVRHL